MGPTKGVHGNYGPSRSITATQSARPGHSPCESGCIEIITVFRVRGVGGLCGLGTLGLRKVTFGVSSSYNPVTSMGSSAPSSRHAASLVQLEAWRCPLGSTWQRRPQTERCRLGPAGAAQPRFPHLFVPPLAPLLLRSFLLLTSRAGLSWESLRLRLWRSSTVGAETAAREQSRGWQVR